MANKTLFAMLAVAIFFLPVFAFAQSTTGLVFLLIEPGSRPGGMANAYVAQVDDAFAGYWNPGALAFNRKVQIAGMHTNWFGDVDGIDDMYIEYLAFNQYFEDIGNIGININYLTYGDQDETDEDGNSLGTFSSYEIAAAVSYGYQLNENVGLGITFKYIYSYLAPDGAGGGQTDVKGNTQNFAFDLGAKTIGTDFGQVLVSPYNGIIALYNGVMLAADAETADYCEFSLPVDNLDFGVNLQNIGPDVVYDNDSQKDPMPMNFRMGFSYRAIENEYSKFTINADMNKILDNRDSSVIPRIFTSWSDDSFGDELDATIFNVGGEYTYMNMLSLRGGYIYDKLGYIEGPSFGAGLQYEFSGGYIVGFDFAMQQGGQLTDYNKTFSVKVDF